MKTTLEIPDLLFRQAKAAAALKGIPLRQFVTESLQQTLQSEARTPVAREPPWMAGFGGLAHLAKKSKRLNALMAEEFGRIERIRF